MATLEKNVEPSLVSVIGISMGDEGKGRVVHEILEHQKREIGRAHV